MKNGMILIAIGLIVATVGILCGYQGQREHEKAIQWQNSIHGTSLALQQNLQEMLKPWSMAADRIELPLDQGAIFRQASKRWMVFEEIVMIFAASFLWHGVQKMKPAYARIKR